MPARKDVSVDQDPLQNQIDPLSGLIPKVAPVAKCCINVSVMQNADHSARRLHSTYYAASYFDHTGWRIELRVTLAKSIVTLATSKMFS
jgi:hypothetical protein